MSRLYDRVMRPRGTRPAPTREAIHGNTMKLMRGAVVIEASEPFEIFVGFKDEFKDGSAVSLSQEIADKYCAKVRQPFPAMFYEAKVSKEEPIGKDGVRAVGVLVMTYDVESTLANGMANTDDPRFQRWREQAHHAIGVYPFIEFNKGNIVGPVGHYFLPLLEDGRILYSEDTSPVFAKAYVRELKNVAEEDRQHLETHMAMDALLDYVFPTLFTTSLMHCKNINLEAHDPPEKLSKKHKRKYGNFLRRYHRITVDPDTNPGAKRGNGGASVGARALHLTRGHFRTYRPPTGPFGRKITEPVSFWVPHHLRGSKSAGEVVSDYSVKVS